MLLIEDRKTCTFEDITTRNPHLLAAKRLAIDAALTDGGILIIGEPGTEKEALAGAVHAAGKRADMPLLEVDCVRLPGMLMEHALFGDPAGDPNAPLLKKSHGGTLLIQEINRLPLVVQSRLVRALQTRKLRLASGEEISFDYRLIATSSEDLTASVEDRLFRADFYGMLTQTTIFIRPLRHRREDVPLLVTKYMHEFSARLDKEITNVSDEAMQALNHYRWPGNVRELCTVVGRSAALAKGETILMQHLPRSVQQSRKFKNNQSEEQEPLPLAVIEKRHIQKVLDHTGWHKVRSAQILGIDRSTLYDKIKRYNLMDPAERLLELARV